MGYLIESDYLPYIQVLNKAAISQNNGATQRSAEDAAVAEAVSILKPKYDTTQEFTNTMVWAASGPGAIPGRTGLTATAWAANTNYAIGNLVAQGGNVYQCITANHDATFTVGNWLKLGATNSIPYLATDRVYLTAASYSAAKAYNVGDLSLYVPAWVSATAYNAGDIVLWTDGNVWQCLIANSDTAFTTGKWLNTGPQGSVGSVYQCNTAIGSGGEAWNAAHWTYLAPINTIFYATYPAPLFTIENQIYQVGDKVYWNGKVYTCLVATRPLTHDGALQYREVQNLPYVNVYPDEAVQGPIVWGVGVTYVVPQGTTITNTTYWTQGDNRDKQMVQKLIDVVVYHLSRNISPKNVPLATTVAYMGSDEHIAPGVGGTIYPVYSALGWLQACARGEICPKLPPVQRASKVSRIRANGNVKNINSY